MAFQPSSPAGIQFRAHNPRAAEHLERFCDMTNVKRALHDVLAKKYRESTARTNDLINQRNRDNIAYGHIPVADDTDPSDVPPGGTMSVPQGPVRRSKKELEARDAAIAEAERTSERNKEALRDNDRVLKFYADVQNAAESFALSAAQQSLTNYNSPSEFDPPTREEFEAACDKANVASHVMNGFIKSAKVAFDDNDIEALVPKAESPFKLVIPGYADRAKGGGRKPSLEWATTLALAAMPVSPGLPPVIEGDPVKIALWLARDQVVAELKKQARAIYSKPGVVALQPAQYRDKLEKLRAAHHLAELEAASAWWRLVDDGIELPPPAVSGRAILLVA